VPGRVGRVGGALGGLGQAAHRGDEAPQLLDPLEVGHHPAVVDLGVVVHQHVAQARRPGDGGGEFGVEPVGATEEPQGVGVGGGHDEPMVGDDVLTVDRARAAGHPLARRLQAGRGHLPLG